MYFISAPFGNYLKFKNTISVTGSWTIQPRPGLYKQIAKTLRYTKTGWRNKIGLRNKGILHAITQHSHNNIMSLAAIDKNGKIDYQKGDEITGEIGKSIAITGPSDDVPRYRLKK